METISFFKMRKVPENCFTTILLKNVSAFLQATDVFSLEVAILAVKDPFQMFYGNMVRESLKTSAAQGSQDYLHGYPFCSTQDNLNSTIVCLHNVSTYLRILSANLGYMFIE